MLGLWVKEFLLGFEGAKRSCGLETDHGVVVACAEGADRAFYGHLDLNRPVDCLKMRYNCAT